VNGAGVLPATIVSGAPARSASRDAWQREGPAVAVPPLEEVSVERVADGFRVRSQRAERAVRRFGVTRALEQACIQLGDAVYIGDTTLIWSE
jgi:hypothetical protein